MIKVNRRVVICILVIGIFPKGILVIRDFRFDYGTGCWR